MFKFKYSNFFSFEAHILPDTFSHFIPVISFSISELYFLNFTETLHPQINYPNQRQPYPFVLGSVCIIHIPFITCERFAGSGRCNHRSMPEWKMSDRDLSSMLKGLSLLQSLSRCIKLLLISFLSFIQLSTYIKIFPTNTAINL